MIKMFIFKEEANELVRFSYNPKIKKSQIKQVLGDDWEHKKLTKKQIKDLGLGVLLDIFGGGGEYYFYDALRSFYPDYSLACFDNDKMMLYKRIYFSSEKKFREVLSLKDDEKMLDSYDFDPSKLSLVNMEYLSVFQDMYDFKVLRLPHFPSARFSIEVYTPSDVFLYAVLCGFDFDMEFDELSNLVQLEDGEKKYKSLYEDIPIRVKELHLFGAEHLSLLSQHDVKYALVQNFK